MDTNGPPHDDFKWFGEGFDGFPKRLPEDTVEYALHVVDSKLGDSQIRSRLNTVLKDITETSKKLLKDYIWQRDGLSLQVARQDDRWALSGRTNYGDSVADEWLIVYLLLEISKKYPDIWIRIYDTDGEFLLIEAANVLPKWVNPEVAENRVWIHEGKLKLIPLTSGSHGSTTKSSNSKSLSVKEALSTISRQPSTLINSPLIEEEAFYRIRNYPAEISSNFHHGTVVLPRNIAWLLHQKPSYISPAIEEFYLRDPIALKPLHSKDPSTLIFPPKDLVAVTIKFTKVGYAQLKGQEWDPPDVWANSIPKDATAKQVSQAEIGTKLACGFEMMVTDPKNQNKTAVREIKLLLEDLANGDEELPTDTEISSWLTKEDSESWLDINFEDFEATLSGKTKGRGEMPKGPSGFGDKAAEENLEKIVERFQAFLNDEAAGTDGAEMMDEMDFDDDSDDDGSDVTSEGEDRDVSFDEAEFSRMMREMMGMPPDDDNVALSSQPKGKSRVEELVASDDEDPHEVEEIQKLSQAMEAELKGYGALNLSDPAKEDLKAKRSLKGKERAQDTLELEGDITDSEEEEEEPGEINVDFNLVKNMLESLKGQAGMAGPAGNMMGLMGINMPRDEDDGHHSHQG